MHDKKEYIINVSVQHLLHVITLYNNTWHTIHYIVLACTEPPILNFIQYNRAVYKKIRIYIMLVNEYKMIKSSIATDILIV